MFAVMVSSINRHISFPTVITWSFILLPSVAVAEGLAELNVKEGKIKIKEGGMEIKEYISLEE